jgi:hypothetical protein
MHRAECIREPNRKSMIPGEEFAKHGEFCFVRYNDDCNCIAGSRRIHTIWEPSLGIQCETKEVGGHSSSHFEPAWWNDVEVSLFVTCLSSLPTNDSGNAHRKDVIKKTRTGRIVLNGLSLPKTTLSRWGLRGADERCSSRDIIEMRYCSQT